MRRLFLGVAVLVVLGASAAGVCWHLMQRSLDTPMVLPDDTALSVASGDTLDGVIGELERRGVVPDPHWLKLHARLTPSVARIKAGDYTLAAGMTPREMLAMLVAGRVDLERITIVEGWTAAEAIAALQRHPALLDDLEVTLDQRADGAPWLSSEAHAALARQLSIPHDSIEGWLFPDTYSFARGTRASVIARQAHSAMVGALDTAWREASAATPVDDRYEALILASIIEKETALDSERRTIAGVFARRLSRGMRLQTDPTVIYGIGAAYDGDIRRRDLQTTTAYNTYQIDGLPPTPIALPGRRSIEAALDPADGKAVYFVASGAGDGSHVFSETLEAHNAAVADYLKRLRQGAP